MHARGAAGLWLPEEVTILVKPSTVLDYTEVLGSAFMAEPAYILELVAFIIIRTLVHEMVHAHFALSCCGDCKDPSATKDQKELCKYLHARALGGYSSFKYNEETYAMPDSSLNHGWAFRQSHTKVGNALQQLTGVYQPENACLPWQDCLCKTKGACLSGCTDDIERVNKKIKEVYKNISSAAEVQSAQSPEKTKTT